MLEESALFIASGMPLNTWNRRLTLERSTAVVTTISNPLGSEKAPGQHELEQATKGTAIRGFSNFGLLNSGQFNIDSVQLHGNERLTQYIGTIAERRPTAISAMKRPAISIAMVTAPACSAHPKDEMTPPMKTVFLRPKLSASHDTASAPMIAPPVKDETMPPVSEAFGLPK